MTMDMEPVSHGVPLYSPGNTHTNLMTRQRLWTICPRPHSDNTAVGIEPGILDSEFSASR